MYKSIKEAAKENGLRVSDLLAMSQKNDPFYAGTRGDVAMAQWFGQIWDEGGFESGAHLRRLHYWVVSMGDRTRHNGMPYENTDTCWGYLCQAAKMARYLDVVDISDIADHKNPDPIESFRTADRHNQLDYTIWPPELNDPEFGTGPHGAGIIASALQPYLIEIWCEKSTMNDVLEPLCQRYNANLVTGEGEMSITAVYDCVQRIRRASRPTRIFYVSDFDPAGQSMPVAVARKLEYMLQKFDVPMDTRLMPTVLTADQVAEYNLPRVPIKESEARRGKFEQHHGTGAVELDALEALHPGALARILKEQLSEHFDLDIDAAARRAQSELNEMVDSAMREVMARYTDEIEALRTMVDELNDIEVDTSDIELPETPEADDPDSDKWMFNSARTYSEQLAHYKAYKGER
jgi:hypothetical protein